jgi:histidine triad (HIT) family protein
VLRTASAVARAVRDAFESDGMSLWQSNGPGAFQEVPHFHLHVMPRWSGDGLLRIYPHRVAELGPDELADQAEVIRRRLAEK